MQGLYDRYSTPEGRAQMEALGLTPRQVDGVLGRTNMFATKALFPRQQEAASYVYLTKLSQFAKSILKRQSHAPAVELQSNGS